MIINPSIRAWHWDELDSPVRFRLCNHSLCSLSFFVSHGVSPSNSALLGLHSLARRTTTHLSTPVTPLTSPSHGPHRSVLRSSPSPWCTLQTPCPAERRGRQPQGFHGTLKLLSWLESAGVWIKNRATHLTCRMCGWGPVQELNPRLSTGVSLRAAGRCCQFERQVQKHNKTFPTLNTRSIVRLLGGFKLLSLPNTPQHWQPFVPNNCSWAPRASCKVTLSTRRL